ncbi:hypothetical protein B5F39_10625 [Cloacibacillus sp. An23]|nr:hypothetical protein B5F39_10625 [Cloacibacillus sp. An23]
MMKIIVLCGGVSSEREVSLNSGAAVADALNCNGYDAETYDVRSIDRFVRDWEGLGADGAFVALHGGWGENGRIQAVMEAFNIPYTGSGPEASMLAMDKTAAKLLFAAAGVASPEGFTAVRGAECVELASGLLKKYGKIVVKPNDDGSTVGLSFVTDISEYAAALEAAWAHKPRALVERYIAGEEATVAVWEKEDGETVALPPVHIKPKTGFYDYKNKYTHGCTEYVCPADFTDEVNDKLRAGALAAHKALGCRVYSRVDFRVTPDGGGFALEANTAPGMTSTSLVPKAAKACGISFGDFLSSIIRRSFSIQRG